MTLDVTKNAEILLMYVAITVRFVNSSIHFTLVEKDCLSEKIIFAIWL